MGHRTRFYPHPSKRTARVPQRRRGLAIRREDVLHWELLGLAMLFGGAFAMVFMACAGPAAPAVN